MKAYQSHKVVEAAKIIAIELIKPQYPAGMGGVSSHYPATLRLEGGYHAEVNASWMAKQDPQVGGYFVRYANGWTSWSPAQAFEEGYTEVGLKLVEDQAFCGRLSPETIEDLRRDFGPGRLVERPTPEPMFFPVAIAKLEVKPGEVLIVQPAGPNLYFGAGAGEKLKMLLEKHLPPGAGIVILSQQVAMQVLSGTVPA